MGPVGHDLQGQRSQGPNILNGNYGHPWYHWKDIFNGNRMALMILTCDLFQGHRDLKGQKWSKMTYGIIGKIFSMGIEWR